MGEIRGRGYVDPELRRSFRLPSSGRIVPRVTAPAQGAAGAPRPALVSPAYEQLPASIPGFGLREASRPSRGRQANSGGPLPGRERAELHAGGSGQAPQGRGRRPRRGRVQNLRTISPLYAGEGFENSAAVPLEVVTAVADLCSAAACRFIAP